MFILSLSRCDTIFKNGLNYIENALNCISFDLAMMWIKLYWISKNVRKSDTTMISMVLVGHANVIILLFLLALQDLISMKIVWYYRISRTNLSRIREQIFDAAV